MHIDMNSYFASCEQQANPLLRGKPIGVCEHLGGIIIAPSVEAKRFGIKTGTPVWEAKKLYPNIILLYADPEKYRETTRRFLKIFYKYTEQIEKYSIDEAFLDITEDVRFDSDPWRKASDMALEIKDKIKKSAGSWIRCSVGISESKLLAKIASDMEKPDGLVIVKPEDKNSLYGLLNLTDIPGISKRTEIALNLLGVKTLEQLRDFPESNLVARFGLFGHHLHQIGLLNGSWHEEFSENNAEDIESKSMGHAYTLGRANSDKKIAVQVLYKLSEMVGRRLRLSGLVGNVIYFHCSNQSYVHFGKRKKISYFTNSGKEIFTEAISLFEKCTYFSKFKLIGVTVAGLKKCFDQQFLFEKDKNINRLTSALDKINDKYGDFTIIPTPVLQAGNIIKDSIGFGRMKEFTVNYKRSKI